MTAGYTSCWQGQRRPECGSGWTRTRRGGALGPPRGRGIRPHGRPGSGTCSLTRAYPKLPAEDVDFSLGLLFSEPPLDQILTVFPRKTHVSLGDCRIRRAGQDVRLGLVVGIQAAGIDDSKGAIVTDLVAVS